MAQEEKPCCPSILPPVTTHNYTPRGKWQKIAGVDVYVVGPAEESSDPAAAAAAGPAKAILAVYDVFGVMPQTVQGCDRVAESVGGWVFMVDFFEGDQLPLSIYPPDTDEKKKTAADWRARRAEFDVATEKFRKVIAAVKEEREEWRNLSWGAYGLCWGGKLVVMNSGKDTLFKASGAAHPGKIEVEEAKALTIPHIVLFSKEDDTPEAVEEYGNAVKEAGADNVVDKYDDMIHGWLSARSNFEDPEVVKAFEKGYSQLAEFFKKHL